MSKPPSFTWPLAVSTFSLTDKLRISLWMLLNDRYTMGEKTAEFERAMTAYSGAHALMVSSGSTANQLVFELWKLKHPGARPVVICPAVTWISSISPAMMAGMDIAFCDINLEDFSFDYGHLANLLDKYTAQDREIIIWPTALIGYCPDMEILQDFADRYNTDLFLDSCENTFSRYPDGSSILSSASMTTTSCYLSHQICSVEGGLVFFKQQSDYDLAKMFRNHGLTRSLPTDHHMRRAVEQANPEVDPAFLFAMAGTNLRPTDVHAMFGLADLKRATEARGHRIDIFEQYREQLDEGKYYLPKEDGCHVGFCLPILSRSEGGPDIKVIKAALREAGIESRPVIGSNLLYQPPFKHLGNPTDFVNAEWIHRNGCYVGLHQDVTPKMIDKLTNLLNAL